MLTPLNMIFVRETVKEKYWERWRGGKWKRERDRQKDSREDLVFSGFQLVWCNSPIGRRVAFSVPPSRTSKKMPDIQTTVHSRNIWTSPTQANLSVRLHSSQIEDLSDTLTTMLVSADIYMGFSYSIWLPLLNKSLSALFMAETSTV